MYGVKRHTYMASVENLKQTHHVEDIISVDGRIILKWFLSKLGGRTYTGYLSYKKRQVAGFCEHGNLLVTVWTVRNLSHGRGKRFLFSPRRSIPALRPSQPSVQWVLPRGVKMPGRQVNRLPPI
jgi:hypothetical protein